MISVLFGAGVLVNYIDRINLSVAASQLRQEFNLSPQEIGLLSSAFFWSYSLLQVPGGMVLDRFGLSEATGYWFRRNERAWSTAVFDSAARFSNAICAPLVAFAIVNLGWRWGFSVTAFLSFAYLLAYWMIYRDPSEDRRLPVITGFIVGVTHSFAGAFLVAGVVPAVSLFSPMSSSLAALSRSSSPLPLPLDGAGSGRRRWPHVRVRRQGACRNGKAACGHWLVQPFA